MAETSKGKAWKKLSVYTKRYVDNYDKIDWSIPTCRCGKRAQYKCKHCETVFCEEHRGEHWLTTSHQTAFPSVDDGFEKIG